MLWSSTRFPRLLLCFVFSSSFLLSQEGWSCLGLSFPASLLRRCSLARSTTTSGGGGGAVRRNSCQDSSLLHHHEHHGMPPSVSLLNLRNRRGIWKLPSSYRRRHNAVGEYRTTVRTTANRRRFCSHLTKLSDTTSTVVAPVVATSTFFGGDLRKVRMEGEEEEEETSSFVAKMSVPTYAAIEKKEGAVTTNGDSEGTNRGNTKEGRRRIIGDQSVKQGLEAVVPGAFVVRNAIPKEICEDVIDVCEHVLTFGQFNAGKNNHGAMQVLVSQSVADEAFRTISKHIDPRYFEKMVDDEATDNGSHGGDSKDEAMMEHRNHVAMGVNRRWRVYRYEPGGVESFAPHIDVGFPSSGLSDDGSTLIWDVHHPDEGIVSRLTVLMYLNDDFDGGHTTFYAPLSSSSAGDDEKKEVMASVKPTAGSFLLFPQAVGEESAEFAREHWPTHEGCPVLQNGHGTNRPKYVIRTDVLFEPSAPPDANDDPLHKYDHLVKETFLPTSYVYNPLFLRHVQSLYNPHMGVECAGPLLHSFVRFTKVRDVVEIGSGYTSLWILQALKDNDEEFSRVRELNMEDKCRLMDYPWTVSDASYGPDRIEGSPSSPSLLCIDNCLHTKQTATEAEVVADKLGLGGYLEFVKADAFAMDFPPESIDLLWCDFGVGSRMKEFISGAWKSIRPGGFLVCHSTLTNLRTREWLEAVRRREGEESTGMPEGEFVEVSFLEPHKRFQNSLSFLQRRTPSFQEPLYSEYA